MKMNARIYTRIWCQIQTFVFFFLFVQTTDFKYKLKCSLMKMYLTSSIRFSTRALVLLLHNLIINNYYYSYIYLGICRYAYVWMMMVIILLLSYWNTFLPTDTWRTYQKDHLALYFLFKWQKLNYRIS